MQRDTGYAAIKIEIKSVRKSGFIYCMGTIGRQTSSLTLNQESLPFQDIVNQYINYYIEILSYVTIQNSLEYLSYFNLSNSLTAQKRSIKTRHYRGVFLFQKCILFLLFYAKPHVETIRMNRIDGHYRVKWGNKQSYCGTQSF